MSSRCSPRCQRDSPGLQLAGKYASIRRGWRRPLRRIGLFCSYAAGHWRPSKARHMRHPGSVCSFQYPAGTELVVASIEGRTSMRRLSAGTWLVSLLTRGGADRRKSRKCSSRSAPVLIEACSRLSTRSGKGSWELFEPRPIFKRSLDRVGGAGRSRTEKNGAYRRGPPLATALRGRDALGVEPARDLAQALALGVLPADAGNQLGWKSRLATGMHDSRTLPWPLAGAGRDSARARARARRPGSPRGRGASRPCSGRSAPRARARADADSPVSSTGRVTSTSRAGAGARLAGGSRRPAVHAGSPYPSRCSRVSSIFFLGTTA